MGRRRLGRFAPGVRRFVEREGAGATALDLDPTHRSARGVEALAALERVSLGSGVRLGPVARLPRLRELHVFGPSWAARDRAVDLGPLAGAPRLESLHVSDARIRGFEAVAHLPSLRDVELRHLRCPDLRPLARLPLRRLVLDGVSGVRLDPLRGLAIEQLDLWGCPDADGLEALATMPNLREVWVFRCGRGADAALELLTGIRDGGSVVLDGGFDPDRHRGALRALESRGVRVFAGNEPHENGVHPSWWGPCPRLARADAEPPRYVSPP